MEQHTDLQEIIEYLNPAELDYQDWVNVGMALKHEGYSVDVWDTWKTLTDDKVSEAEKLAQMTNEEKANYRAKKAEDALKEMQRQNARSDMAKEARKMLADEDINIPDELVMNLVAEDADGTKAAVEAFSTMYKEAVQKAVKDALKGKPPKAGNGGDKPSMTKEQILAVKNPSERQKLIAENITLFQ